MNKLQPSDEEPAKKKFDRKDRLAAGFFCFLVAGLISFGIAVLLSMPNKRTGASLLIDRYGALSGWFWVIGFGGSILGGLFGLLVPRLALALGEKIRKMGRDR